MSGTYDFIAVFVDCLTKMAHFVPCNSDITARGFARLFLENVVRLHGLPRKVISDCGTQFNSSFTREFYKVLGIEANMTTAYHPQTDGQTERVNRDLLQYLRMFTSYWQDDWHTWLNLAEIAYNNHSHAAIKMSPFYANYGRHPPFGEINKGFGKNQSGVEFSQTMEMVWKLTQDNMKRAASQMKEQFDKCRKSSMVKVGDKVLLEGKNIKMARPSEKLSDRQYGLFEVLEKVGEALWKLKLPKGWKRIHPIFKQPIPSV